MYKEIGLRKPIAQFNHFWVPSLINLAIQIEWRLRRPAHAHLMIELVTIDTFTIDRIATVEVQIEVVGSHTRGRLLHDKRKFFHARVCSMMRWAGRALTSVPVSISYHS
ncbi:hypothetical protein D1610_07135 [Sphingomonas gilva]|uniref:Uncharacterized protein n=1 Tax=Sphingomonas gilva TaxID=2305907 RepID=A0A396RSD5_9SPHN|nr:hypothetical protein D1610_07135 [Sphingomonas gilva]